MVILIKMYWIIIVQQIIFYKSINTNSIIHNQLTKEGLTLITLEMSSHFQNIYKKLKEKMQNQYFEHFAQTVDKAFQTHYPIFAMLPGQKRNEITNGLYELLPEANRDKFKEYLAGIYFNADDRVDKFITEITKQSKQKERTYEEFSRKAITTFQFIYPVFKVFEKAKQEDILSKLYVYANKPNDDKIKEILANIYLNDESLQNEFIEEVFYEAIGNEPDGAGLYDTFNQNDFAQEQDLNAQYDMKEEYQQWHQELILQIQQIGCQSILQSKIRVQQVIAIEKQCPELERFSHELEKQSSSNNIEEIKKLLNNYRYDEKILQNINKIQAPNTSNKEKIYLWRKVREEIQILNIHEIYRSKEKIIEEEKQVKDKQGILIAGISGVGKTTFFLKMAGIKLKKNSESKFNEQFQAQDPAVAKQFKISSRSVSCTKEPGMLIPKPQHTDAKKIVLIDTAGFEDSRSSQIDIINNMGTMKYIQQLRTLRIVIILSRNILGERCSGLKRFGRLVANYFRNFRDVEQSISYVLTKNLTISDLSQAVELILKEIEAASNDSFGGYNYGFFFYHLKDQLDNQNVKEFHPNKCYVKQFLSMFILKKQALYNPAQYLNAAFSMQSLEKIKRKSFQLQKMIIQTYKKRQFSMTSYYMNLLQKLQNLDQRNTQIDILYKCHIYIQEQNSLLSKKYEVNLNKFFETNAKQLLETAEKIKEIAKQAQLLKDPTQQRKYAYEIICEIAALKVDEIISSFSKKQQLQKQKHSSFSVVNYFKASLEFLKLQNRSLFEKICNMMDQDKQNITKKIKLLIEEKKIDEDEFKDAFQKYMDFFHYKDEETQDKREKRLKQIQRIFENALKDSQEEQTVVKIIHFGYEGAFEGQIVQVKNYLQKLIVIENQDLYLKQVVEPHFKRVVNQLKKLIGEYTILHKQNKIPFEPEKFKKIKLFQQNYDQILEVMQMVQDAQIMNFHYKIGMAEYVKNIRNSLQWLIDSLNKEINQYYRDFYEINPRQIKRMFNDLKTHIEFLEEVHNQYKHVASIEDTVKDAERSVARFISKIQKRSNKQFIKGFEINIKLLVDLVMIEELTGLQKIESQKEKYEEIKIAIIEKLLTPLYKMMTVVQEFQPIDNNTGQGPNVFMTGQNSHGGSKFVNILIEPIVIIDEYQTQKLYKLLDYFRKLHELLQELQDQRNLQFQVNISYTQNEQLKQVILAFFKRKEDEYNSLFPIIMRNEQDPGKSKEMKRIFNYKLKENCIRYIKSYNAIEKICHEFQDIDVVEQFQRNKLNKINLKTKIQARLEKISRDFDLNEAENFTLKELKDSFHEYLFLNQIHQDTKSLTKGKSFKEVQTKIEKFMKRHYSDWRTLFAYLQRQLNENELNIEFEELIHLFSKQAMKIQANQKQFYAFLQRIDKVINNKLNHINSNFVDCQLEEKYEVIQKICQFKLTSTKINYTPTFKDEPFRTAYLNYFQELSEQFQKTKKKIQEGIFVSEKDQNKLFSSEIKIQMLLKDDYSNFLQEKYKQAKPLRESFEQYSKEIIQDLKTKYLGDDIKLDQKFSEFYKKTNKQNQQNIDKALLKMYQSFEKQLVNLAKQDKNKYENKMRQVSDMIELMPQRKKNEFQKRLVQKNKQILKQEDEMITKANEFKQKKDIGKILNELDRATRMKHEEIIEKTVRIIRDYFEEEIKSIQPKNVTFLEQILNRNVSKLQSQRSWNEMKTIYPELQEKHQEFYLSLEDKVVQQFISIIEKIQALPAKFLYENPVDGYTYHQLDRHPDSEQLTAKLIELYNLIIKHENFFAERMEEMNLSLTKLLENNKDNLQENINVITDAIAEFKKSKPTSEESYVKNIILGSINACLMKILKEGIDKVSNQKKKKDLLQAITLALANQFYQKIAAISSLMQDKMQNMMQFSIKKQLPNNPLETITTILKNKQNQTRILNFNLKVFKINKIPPNWLQEVKITYYNQYVDYEKYNEQIVEKSFQNVTIENEQEVREFLKIRAALQDNKFSFFPTSAKTKNISSLIEQRVEQLKAKVTEFYSGRNTKSQYEEMVKESQRLRQEQLEKLNLIQEEVERQEKKIKQSIAEEMEREIKKVPHNDKRVENMEKVKKEMESKKSSKLNDLSVRTKLQAENIQKKYAKSLDPLDRKLIAFLEFNLINYMIIYRKNVSTYNFVDKIMNEHNFITNQLQNIKRVYGTLTIKKIYDILCNHDNQYGQMIKNEQKMFETYQKRIFKELTQTQDIHYLFKNIKEIADNPKTKNLLEERYNRYEKTYNECIHKYEKNGGTELARKDIIEQTLKLAAEIKQEYEKGVYSNCNKEDLVAHIFAVWSIIKSCTNEDYQIQFVYQPHPAQILAIFLLLGLDAPKKTIQKVQKCMVQISTGEGKSVVLAGLSVFLALVGFDVYEACYSKYLSERDYKEFQILFDTLNIKPKIKYNIFPEICRQVLNQSEEETFNQKVYNILMSGGIAKNMESYFSNLISNNKKTSKSILIIDEADVFINREFLGQVYSPSINIVGDTVNKLLDFIWSLRESQPHPDNVFQSAQFQALLKQLPHFADVFKNQVHAMLRGLKNFKSDSYKVIDDKIWYKEGDGLSALIHHGYRTIFAYYHEHFVNQEISYESFRRMISMNLIIAHFSYSRLPTYFDSILGVTGTLQHISKGQKRLMEEQYGVKKTYIMPSIYGLNSKRLVEFEKVHSLKLYTAIVKNIEEVHRKKRPIIVFFKTKGQVNDFFDSREFLPYKDSACRVTHEDSAKQRDFRVQTSTFEGKITIMTSDFSRGTDFKLNVKNINEHEGLHVIQAFMPESLCDYIQLIGRTGRQGKNGSVVIFAVDSQKQGEEQKSNLTIKQGEQIIEKADNNKWNQEFQEIKNRILKANKSHEESIRLYTKSKTVEEVIKKIYEFNEEPLIRDLICKTILALDGTSSMQSVFNKVKDVIKEAFPRLYDTLKHRKINGSFEIMICVYRNYNSRPELLMQKTNFETKSTDLIEFLNKIRVDGGWGNEAIEVCFNHVNSLPEVDQIIIIGDAAANNKHQTKQRKGSKKINWEQKGYPETNIEIETAELIRRKIEVHSYYLAAEKYFKKLSEDTGGVAEFFEIRNPEAVENFTNFISFRILSKLEELSGDAGDLVKYYEEKYVKKRYL